MTLITWPAPNPGSGRSRYEPSLENMRELLTLWFAVDPSIITDDLVRIRYEAGVESWDAYGAMFWTMVNLLPESTPTSSPAAGTGPRSSAPRSSPSWWGNVLRS